MESPPPVTFELPFANVPVTPGIQIGIVASNRPGIATRHAGLLQRGRAHDLARALRAERRRVARVLSVPRCAGLPGRGRAGDEEEESPRDPNGACREQRIGPPRDPRELAASYGGRAHPAPRDPAAKFVQGWSSREDPRPRRARGFAGLACGGRRGTIRSRTRRPALHETAPWSTPHATPRPDGRPRLPRPLRGAPGLGRGRGRGRGGPSLRPERAVDPGDGVRRAAPRLERDGPRVRRLAGRRTLRGAVRPALRAAGPVQRVPQGLRLVRQPEARLGDRGRRLDRRHERHAGRAGPLDARRRDPGGRARLHRATSTSRSWEACGPPTVVGTSASALFYVGMGSEFHISDERSVDISFDQWIVEGAVGYRVTEVPVGCEPCAPCMAVQPFVGVRYNSLDVTLSELGPDGADPGPQPVEVVGRPDRRYRADLRLPQPVVGPRLRRHRRVRAEREQRHDLEPARRGGLHVQRARRHVPGPHGHRQRTTRTAASPGTSPSGVRTSASRSRSDGTSGRTSRARRTRSARRASGRAGEPGRRARPRAVPCPDRGLPGLGQDVGPSWAPAQPRSPRDGAQLFDPRTPPWSRRQPFSRPCPCSSVHA